MKARRIGWYGLLACVAVGAAGLQLDRQSASSPAIAPLVPEPFRSTAQARIVATALSGDDAGAALTEARKLVARRPIPAQNLRLLALAQFKAGEIEQGSLSIQLSARRGWRDVAAQEAMARLALGAGDMPEAARRFTALLARQETPDALLVELGQAIFGEPGGAARTTMGDIVANSERWSSLFLRRGPQVMPPDAFSEVAIASIKRGMAFDCAEFDRAVRALEVRGEGPAANLATNRPERCRNGDN